MEDGHNIMISEKTDEEKLRQELEGSPGGGGHDVTRRAKPLRPARRINPRRSDKPDNISIIDTFMEDFERKVEQSLNASNIRSSHHESVKPIRKPDRIPKESTSSEALSDILPVAEDSDNEISPTDAEDLPVAEDNNNEISLNDADDLPVAEENDNEISLNDAEDLPVVEDNDNEISPTEADDLPDIPVLEAETEELPDIPVIHPDSEASDDDTFSDDIIYPQDDEIEEPEAPEEPEEPEQTPKALPEFQEAELVEGPEIDDDDEELADVVVNVDDVLPQIEHSDEASVDPESESVPVTVTMPESTKTAEDKLMADIAEAMTGNPLSLDSKDFQPAYNLPENFFAGNDSQSAEDKLKANIAQALSESPIDAAQSKVNQDIEQDLNPFDEISMPDNLLDEPSEEQPEDDEAQDTDTEDFADLPFSENTNEDETVTEDAPLTQDISTEDFDDLPFSEDANEDETVTEDAPLTQDISTEDFDDLPFSEDANESETVTEDEPLTQDINTEDSDDLPFSEDSSESETVEDDSEISTDDFAGLPFSLGDDDENEPEPVETFTQEQDKQTPITQEEAQPENKMPEESLLDDEVKVDESNDDWDISSLGELSQAATIPDDEHEDIPSVPETLTEVITQPEPAIKHSNEDDYKEKTMSIREKLASRKKPNSSTPSASGGKIVPILLILLLTVGGLLLWQIMQLSDNITSLARNSTGSFESVTISEPKASYDYAIEFILDPNLTDRMSQRGRDGWQVVGSRRTQDSTSGQYGYEFIFMRRITAR